MLNHQVILRVILEEFHEAKLLHPHEVLLREAEFVLHGGVELVDVCGVPPVLIVGDVQLDLLAADVEVGGVGECDEVYR